MPIPDRDAVERTLAVDGRGAAIFRAINNGWKRVQERYPESASWRRRSTRAALVWENAVDNVIHAIGTQAGVRVEHHHDTVSFVLDDTVLIRIKKANIELLSSNVRTDLSELFHEHRQDLFGYTGLHRVEAVYVLNRLQTNPLWIGIVARDKRRVLWNLGLDPNERVVAQLNLAPRYGVAAERVLKTQTAVANKKVEREE